MPLEPRYLGQSVKRREDPRFLLGKGLYVDDVPVTGVLHAAFVRSDYAHARVLNVDTSAALALDGVVAVLTGQEAAADWEPMRYDSTMPGWQSSAFWALAKDKVRFVGEAIACVVATDRYIAEDGVDLVEVDYEPLEPVADVAAAMAPGAPLIHENWVDNRFLQRHVETDGFADALEGCAHRVSLRLEMARHSGQPMETRGVSGAMGRACRRALGSCHDPGALPAAERAVSVPAPA